MSLWSWMCHWVWVSTVSQPSILPVYIVKLRLSAYRHFSDSLAHSFLSFCQGEQKVEKCQWIHTNSGAAHLLSKRHQGPSSTASGSVLTSSKTALHSKRLGHAFTRADDATQNRRRPLKCGRTAAMYEKWSVPLLGGTETTETEGRVWLCEGPFLGTSAAIQQVPLRIVNLLFNALLHFPNGGRWRRKQLHLTG